MFKFLMISIVAVPVLMGAAAARSRDGRRGLVMLLGALLIYDMLYLLMLYYLRFRWSAG